MFGNRIPTLKNKAKPTGFTLFLYLLTIDYLLQTTYLYLEPSHAALRFHSFLCACVLRACTHASSRQKSTQQVQQQAHQVLAQPKGIYPSSKHQPPSKE